MVSKTIKRIAPSRIAFDFDGVCADTMGLFLKLVEAHYGIVGLTKDHITRYSLEECLPISAEEIHRLIGIILNGTHDLALEPMEGAAEVLTRVGRCCSPLRVITARPFPGPIPRWLQDILPLESEAVHVVAVGSAQAKAVLIREKEIDFFVDDQLDVCFELQKGGVTPIVFKQPWNRQDHPFLEVSGWRELDALIG
jgi:hypothetical protein